MSGYHKIDNQKLVMSFNFFITVIVLAFSLGWNTVSSLISTFFNTVERIGIDNLFEGFNSEISQLAITSILIAGMGVASYFVAGLLSGAVKLKCVCWPMPNPSGNVHILSKKHLSTASGALKERFPQAFNPHIDAADRQSYWYDQIYRPVRNETAVSGANKDYLLAREVYIYCLIMTIVLVVSFLSELWGLQGLIRIQSEGVITAVLITAMAKIVAMQKGRTLVLNSLVAIRDHN